MVAPPGLDLGQEAFSAQRRGKLLVDDLDRDFAIVFQVMREIDGGHPARAEFPLDAIAVGKCIAEAIRGVHGR